jgi:hypothetical protein
MNTSFDREIATIAAIGEIERIFQKEFSFVKDKFVVKPLSMDDAKSSQDPEVVLGGVYVWIKGSKVYKVGRHLINTRKRALEHIRDNTGGKLKAFENDQNVILLLFNVKKPEDIHWAFALEDYFERKLEPVVNSKRRG